MRKPVRFVHSLSFKLALTTIGMLLVMWLAVGAVLVLSTAHEIMDNSYDAAQAKSQEYRYDSYMQAYQGSQDASLDIWWLEHGCELQFDFLFPRTNSEPNSRYIQYNLAARLNDTDDLESLYALPAHSLVGIRVQSDEVAQSGTFLSLEDFTPQQLSAISRQLAGNTLPSLTASGSRNGLLFQVSTLTLGEQTYTSSSENTSDSIIIKGGTDIYRLFPSNVKTVQEWTLFLSAEEYALGGFRNASNSYFTCYTQSISPVFLDSNQPENLYGEESTHEPVWVSVIMISTPLKTALQEQAPVLIRLLALIPILGILFFGIIRRMVVLPLRKTQTAFQTVAALNFSEVKGDVKRRDEIGELNRSLQTMSGELQQHWDDERALERRRQEFVAAASHELKTPLALIRGYTEGLEQDIGDREQYLAGMEREIDRMNALVLDMLEETRLERMEQLQQLETVNLSCLIKDLLDEMAPLFQGLNLSVQLEEGVTCPGNRSLLERGIGNLLSNAARYCSPGGQVRITLTSGPALTVENDADPIPEEELPRLFELFYRGDKARDRSGSGMGLAIARRIFSLHHLSCTAENIPGGVRFRLQKEACSGTNPSKMS